MKTSRLTILLLSGILASCGVHREEVSRPRIVVGIVVDQMRWDYLYRYYEHYGHSGFKRLMRDGYNCQQTMINYLPAYTAPGHTCVYTGSVPSLHGIAGNEWMDRNTGEMVYCTDDATVKLTEDGRPMSPANLLVTTVTDELRLATNFESRVYGVAIKDRASILPAGHLANAAYWYNEQTGHFVSSSYYSNPTPAWLQSFNNRNVTDSLLGNGWYLLHNEETYTESTADSTPYEGAFPWEKEPVFPHRYDTVTGPRRNAIVKTTPAGNTLSIMMAKECIEGESLGKGAATDFLTLSLSATDYVGHRFAPNSMEAEDTYLRLDRDIADFLFYLDKRYGRNGYLVFLTADHGGAHNAQFLIDHNVPAGMEPAGTISGINEYLQQLFGLENIVTFTDNYQVCLDEALIARSGKDRAVIRQTIINWLEQQPAVAYTLDMENLWSNTVPEPIKTMAVNGYHKNRSGSIQIIPAAGWYGGNGHKTGTTHGTWNPYDTHIPLIWFGWNIKRGESNEQVHMTDIAPTLASLLHIQMPNGCIGKPINVALH